MDSAKTIVCDCDGVLTDGKMYMDHTGEKMFKAFCSRDVRAIRELVAHGYRFVIVSADESDITKAFAEKTGAEVFFTRDKSDLPFENFIAVGDDAWDVPMLKQGVKAYIPVDADPCTFKHAAVINTRGGHGVIASLVNILMN